MTRLSTWRKARPILKRPEWHLPEPVGQQQRDDAALAEAVRLAVYRFIHDGGLAGVLAPKVAEMLEGM